MPYQTSANVLVAIQEETARGTAATDSSGSADQMRITDSPGLKLARAKIISKEKRDDGNTTMGRIGGKSVDGSFNGELSIGGVTDMMLEAILRSAWVATDTAITCDGGGVYTSLQATGTAELTLAGTGSFITEGFKVGDVVRIGAGTPAGNDDLNLRVITVTANVMTFAGTPIATGAADTNATLTILKKVVNATTPARRTYTVEQYKQDIDLTELFLGCVLTGLKLSFKPGAHATVQYTFKGTDRTALAEGTSPYFTSPVLTTGLGLIADDSSIWKNGAAVTTFTGFDLDLTIAAKSEPVIGSFVSPDVFDNDLMVSGSITGLRSDFANITLYDAETEFELWIALTEPNTSPTEILSLYLPRVKIADLSAPAGGGDGAEIETLELMIGPLAATATENATVMSVCSSAANHA
jgi:hypothetical protein